MNIQKFLWLAILASLDVAADDWQPVTGQETLSETFSDTEMKGSLPGENEAVAHYRADGTGTLTEWGGTFERRWKVENGQQICVLADQTWICSTVERSVNDPSRYRAIRMDTGESVEFVILNGERCQRNKAQIKAAPRNPRPRNWRPSWPIPRRR